MIYIYVFMYLFNYLIGFLWELKKEGIVCGLCGELYYLFIRMDVVICMYDIECNV